MKSAICLENYHNKLEKLYGDPNYNNQEKAKETRLKHYGDENFNNRKKCEETNLEKYGTKYPIFQLKEYKDLARQIKFERYNDENFNNREKAENTCIENYGVKNPCHLEEIKKLISWIRINKSNEEKKEIRKKKEYTCIEIYGVKHPSQSSIYQDKIQYGYKNSWHDYILPSGKEIKLQGYEPQALDDLLETYTEEEIFHKKSEVPEIWYQWNDNTWHRYYPDFYIPKDNLVIEVKSTYTYKRYLEINLLKEEATKYLGYNFKLMIL